MANEVELLDEADRRLINRLQEGLPLVDEPYEAVGAELGMSGAEVITRLRRLLETGVLSRFGPLFQIEKGGGRFLLAALAVPEERFAEVAAIVNAFPEVAHNYRREHVLNMWFVVACEKAEEASAVLARIEAATGLAVHAFPKEREYFVGLKLDAR